MSQTDVGDSSSSACTHGASAGIFGYPGDGINGVFGALNRAGGKIRFIQARHEEMAAFMASALRQVHRRARRLHRDFRPRRLASGDRALRRAARPHAGAGHLPANRRALPWAATTSRRSISRACSRMSPAPSCSRPPRRRRSAISSTAPIRIALGERRVTAIILPNDLQEMSYEEPPRAHGTLHSGVGFTRPRTVPYEPISDAPQRCSTAGKKVAMLVGAGALEPPMK